ncbi:MAG: GAF domain-containing protein, partial [Pseudonocardia sp.]
MSDVTGGSRWPELIETVLGIEAAQDSGSAVRLLEATLAFVGCVGAQLVEWVHQRPSPVCGAGRSLRLASRPAEGLAAFAGHPLAVGRVDEYRDLVLIREPWDEPFGPEAAEHARALATLLRHTPSVGRKDAVEALHRLSTEIVRTLDVDRVLLAISNAAARLSSSEIAGVFLVHDGPEGPELRMQSVVGHRTMETARLRVRKGRGIAGKVLDTGRPQRVDQYATTTEITKDYFAIAMQEGTQSGLSIPMCDTDGTIIGVLSTWRRRASVYSEEDEDLLVSLAGLATIGIVNARRYHQQQQATAAVEAARAQLQQRLRASDEALAIHRTLTEIAAEGLDLLALAEALHEFLGGPVVIAPSNDRAPVQYPPARPGEPALAPDPRQHERGHERDRQAAGPRWVGAPVEAAGVRRGVIHVLLPRRPAARDIVTLEQAATICAVLLMHETLLDATVGRLRSEFVWDLLEGRRSPSGDDAGRACSLGLRLHYPARVVLVAADGLDTLARAMRLSAEQHHHHRALITSRIGKALSGLAGQDVPLASRDERVAVIVPASAVPDADALVQALRECSPFATVSLRAGVSSRKAEPDLLAEGLREARVALTAAAGSARAAVLFDDLGVLQFLLGSGGALELDDYARRVLGPLVDYDARHDAQLVATL